MFSKKCRFHQKNRQFEVMLILISRQKIKNIGQKSAMIAQFSKKYSDLKRKNQRSLDKTFSFARKLPGFPNFWDTTRLRIFERKWLFLSIFAFWAPCVIRKFSNFDQKTPIFVLFLRLINNFRAKTTFFVDETCLDILDDLKSIKNWHKVLSNLISESETLCHELTAIKLANANSQPPPSW